MHQTMWPLLPMERTDRIERRARHRLQKMARLGHGAKGFVYLLVGGLAAAAAWSGGRAAGTEGALRTLAAGPFGTVLLGVLALGLAAYSVWRLYSAVTGGEGEGTGERIAQGVTAIVYGALAIEAARLAIGAAGGGEGANHWTAVLMSQPFGSWLVGGAGIALIGYAIYQFRRALNGPVGRELDVSAMRERTREWTERLGRTGIGARAISIALIGVFLVIAALQSDPSEARGLGGALRTLAEQPFGPWLLVAIAIGLAAYGVFQILKAVFPPVTLRRAT